MQGIRDVNDLCAKLSSLEEQGAKILKASDEAVAQVHTRYKREIDQLRREFEGQLTIGKAEADESDGCMDRALEIIGSIGNDIVLVDSHLKKMGLTERRQESCMLLNHRPSVKHAFGFREPLLEHMISLVLLQPSFRHDSSCQVSPWINCKIRYRTEYMNLAPSTSLSVHSTHIPICTLALCTALDN